MLSAYFRESLKNEQAIFKECSTARVAGMKHANSFLSDRRLSSGHSGALLSDGRRRKKEPAVIPAAKKDPVVTASILTASTEPALRAGRRRLFQG